MARDKGYGSGKPRSAANSRARQRAAAGNFTKGAKPLARGLKKIAAENPVTGFIGGGFLPVGRAAQIASRLVATGQASKAAMVARRSAAAEAGRTSSRLFAEATAKSGSLGNTKFQKLAQAAWDQKWLGQNLREISRNTPKVASLASRRPKSLKVNPSSNTPPRKWSSTHLYVKPGAKLVPGSLPRYPGATGSKRGGR